MESKKKAVLHVGNVLVNVSLGTLAAIGGATANPLLAGSATATLAAKEGIASLLRTLKGKNEEVLELSKPHWWNGDEQSWQDTVAEIEARLPRIIEATAEHLKREGQIPTTERRQQTLQNELRSHLNSFLIGANDKGLVANEIGPPFFQRVAVLLNEATSTIRDDAIASILEEIAQKLAHQPTTQVSQALITTDSPTVVNAASAQLQLNVKEAQLEQKWQAGKYDVYICYHKADREKMRPIDARLKAEGVLPWYDILTTPGVLLQSEQEEQIRKIPAAAVFLGEHAMEHWSVLEIYALIDEAAQRGMRLLPVILENAPEKPEISCFLQLYSGVDFRQKDPDPFMRLMWGIKGKRPPLSSL